MEKEVIQNYIYLYHTDQFIVLPVYPDTIQDSMGTSFNSYTPLSRTAPVYSYSNSGPRSINISLSLHRDMMDEINMDVSNLTIEIGDDYIDTMIKQLQAIAYPVYSSSTKMVNPPMVAIRFGNEIYIKGIVNVGISVTYSGPLGEDNKYKKVDVGFTVYEVDTYDANSVQIGGSFRGLSKTLERRLYKK